MSLRPTEFDDELGRRLVALRVLGVGDHPAARPLRWMIAPSREALSEGWNADPTARLSLAYAYLRRAVAMLPAVRSALRRPWSLVQDHRLNGQIRALEGEGISRKAETLLDERLRRRMGSSPKEAQGETVLLRLQDGGYYALEEVGAMIWDLCDGNRSVGDIVTILCAEFDAPRRPSRPTSWSSSPI